jgi:endo-beta-N-acetylglucosaminidase D
MLGAVQLGFLGRGCALAAIAATPVIASSAVPAWGARPFATGVAAGPVSISCESAGSAAGRVRITAQVGYSDVARGLEAPLRRSRHRGSVSVRVATPAGRMLARVSDIAALGLGSDRDRIYFTHEAVLDKRAGTGVLRYAHGTNDCRGKPKRDRRVEVLVGAGQVLSVPRARAGASASTLLATQAARWSAQTAVVRDSIVHASSCPPYPCYATAAALLAWDPASVRRFDFANVPLANRVQRPVPRMLVGFDNGPWSFWTDFDRNAQGSAQTGNVYNFSHWQYVDSFYYYMHQLVSVPPTVWVDAAHRNGVAALGTVTSDCNGCGHEMDKLFQRHRSQAVQKLRRLAATYGFDGWLIDIENGARLSRELITGMGQLARQTLPNGRRVQVTWYRAGTEQLDDHAYRALQAAGSWQSDYDHMGDSPRPRATYDLLAHQTPPGVDRRYDAYWATDVFRPPYDQPAAVCGGQSSGNYLFNGRECNDVALLFANQRSARAPSNPPAFFQSLALFAPDWTMYAGLNQTTDPRSPRDVFQAVDQRLWAGTGGYRLSEGRCELAQPGQNSVSALVRPRSVLTRVPFVTRFNTGEGSDFFVEGRAAGGGNWNMLSAQDPAPTEACGEGDTLGASIDYDDAAYDGGSSLRIAGTATADSRRLYLYETNAPLPQRAAFTLRYRQLPARGGAAPEPHVVVWVDGKGPIDLEPTRRSTTGQRWTSIQAQLPADVLPATLTRIGVGFDLERSQPIDTLIGELGVADLDAYQPPTQIRRHASAGKLTWHDPSPSTTQYYNVWTVRRSCLAFVGRTTLQLYDLSHPLFGTPATRGRFVVQPVNTSGLASHLSPPPC